MFFAHVLDLGLAHAVLAGAGAAHVERATHEALHEGFRLGDVVRVARIELRTGMEIAVADVADDRRDNADALGVLDRFGHAIGQPRDRHADVGREARHFRLRLQRLMRPVDVMARLPEFRALLGLGRPVERTAAIAFRQLLEARGLLRHARFRAVEFQKQHRRLGQAELGVIVERAHGERIDEFDARDRQAGLDRLDDRVAGRLDRRELAGRRRNGFRNSEELQRDLGDDAERALRSHEQTREIVAGGRLLRAPRRLDDAPVRHDDGERQHIVLHRSVAHRVGAGRARRAHAADGGVGAGVDREEQAGVA